MPVRLNKKQIIFLGLLITGFFATIVSQTLAATWTGPTATPPGANKEEPINVGTTPQSKDGYLLLRNSGASNNLSLQEIGSGNILSFRVNNSGSGSISNWVLPSTAGTAGQALVVSSVAGDTMNLSWSSSAMPAGSVGATWYWASGIPAWQNNTNIYNDGIGNVGIHLGNGVQPNNFQLEIGGNAGPNVNGAYDLGSSLLKWNNVYATTLHGAVNPGFTFGSVYFQSPSGMTEDNANFYWDNSNDNLGLGTNTPNARLHTYKTSGQNAEIDIQSTAGAGNHWGIYDDRLGGTNELRFWKGGANRFSFGANGVMTLGTVPWERLPAASCGGATPVVTGFNSSGPICGPGSTLADPGATGSTIYWNGTAWVGSTNIYNNNGNVGVGVVNPTDFKLQVNGSVGPDTNNTYDLGSAAKRWANLYATNLNVSGNFNPGFTLGSVYFQGASGLAQDTANFYWDDTNNRLGLGTNAPANFLLDAAGSVGPHANDTYDLGSNAMRWRNLFVNNISTTLAGLNLAVPAKALVFGVASGAGNLDTDSSALFYDKATSVLTTGHLYPNTTNTFDLGSSSLRWRDFYVQNVKINGFTTGSVVFQGASGNLSENNNNFFWDNTNSRLGINTNYPLDTVQIMQGRESTGGWYNFPSGSCQMQISGTTAVVGIGQGGEDCWFTHDLAVGSEIARTGTNEYRKVVQIIDNTNLVVDRAWASSGTFAFSSRIRSLGILKDNGAISFNGGSIDPTYGPVAGVSMIHLGNKLFIHNSGFSDNLGSGINTAGSNFYFSNTFIGEGAGSGFAADGSIPAGQLNTALGYFALQGSNTDSYANTAIGGKALSNNQGSYNVAVGSEALIDSTGSGNVSVGYQGSETPFLSASSYNSNLGYRAGASISTGQRNTYLGAEAGSDATTGSENVFIGSEAGKSIVGNLNGYLIINNKDSNQYNSLLYGKFSTAFDSRNTAFLRINGDLQFGYGANAVKGKTIDAGGGLCINQGANNLQMFLVNGVVICTRAAVADCNAVGFDFAGCCAAQGGCQ